MHFSEFIPTTSPEVLATLDRWCRDQPELLVRTRGRSCGNEEFKFFSSLEALKQAMRDSSPYTWFSVWEKPQLPLRGIVDDNFIERCMSSVTGGDEYLIVETIITVAGKVSWFHNLSGDVKASLRDDLETSRGTPVAFGLYPPCLEERDDVIHAFTPDADGIVKPGPY